MFLGAGVLPTISISLEAANLAGQTEEYLTKALHDFKSGERKNEMMNMMAKPLSDADIAFAEVCGFDLSRWPKVADWTRRLKSLPGFVEPFDLLPMRDADL